MGLWKSRQKGSHQSNYRPGASAGGPETDEKGDEEPNRALKAQERGYIPHRHMGPQNGNRR